MSTPNTPPLQEVQNFFKNFAENQEKICANFQMVVHRKKQQTLIADDPDKQKKLEKTQEKYHKKLDKSCDNLKKQGEMSQKVYEDSLKIKKGTDADTIKLLQHFQNHMHKLHKEWEELKMEVAVLENEIVSFLAPNTQIIK